MAGSAAQSCLGAIAVGPIMPPRPNWRRLGSRKGLIRSGSSDVLHSLPCRPRVAVHERLAQPSVINNSTTDFADTLHGLLRRKPLSLVSIGCSEGDRMGK